MYYSMILSMFDAQCALQCALHIVYNINFILLPDTFYLDSKITRNIYNII